MLFYDYHQKTNEHIFFLSNLDTFPRHHNRELPENYKSTAKEIELHFSPRCFIKWSEDILNNEQW